MTRSDIAMIALGVVAVVIVTVLCWVFITSDLACGDRGGTNYWGPFLRHVCIAPDGRVLP